MFIAMNNFKVVAGKEGDFEQVWKTRETHLRDVPGFVRFASKGRRRPLHLAQHMGEPGGLRRLDEKSEAFTAGHRQGGSLMGVLEGPPQVRLYDAVIEQEFAKA